MLRIWFTYMEFIAYAKKLQRLLKYCLWNLTICAQKFYPFRCLDYRSKYFSPIQFCLDSVFLFWPIISTSTFFDGCRFKILALFHNFKRYRICKYIVDINFITVPTFSSTDIIYRDLMIINIFRYLDLFWSLGCVNYLFCK